ncbi:cupin domain-containing protein [uncultured Roseibium sp.]|uniref:cupin domain-containing protein n=1 Tax=uncultured Roseibium sp. TaxID=1936171 RepID=UPI002639AC83|nr:cupin domain-containing protein [uncultured Roseibium sp.]
MAREFRRVVTGHDENGVAIVESDGIATNRLQRENRPGVTLTNFWRTDGTPAEYDGATETCDGPLTLHPPKNGSVFRVVEFMPEDPEVMKSLDGKAAFAEMGAGDNIVENARHPWMHRTDSLDYAVVLTGEIYMLMDEEDVLLKAGDVVIQRGTNHAWSNRGTEPCSIAFVLVDGVTQRSASEENLKGIPKRP